MKLIMNRTYKMAASICLSAVVAFGLYASAPHAFAASASGSSAAAIIAEGKTLLGTPYQYGAPAGRTDEFDCSSFIQHIFADHGITLPRSSKEQSTAGVWVSRQNLQPGDLVFFYSPIHHVAVYIGNGQIMHTYGKPGVTVSNLNSGWWNDHFTTARRVLPNGTGASTGTASATPTATTKPAVGTTVGTAPTQATSPTTTTTPTQPAKVPAPSAQKPVAPAPTTWNGPDGIGTAYGSDWTYNQPAFNPGWLQNWF